jgi:uncharacterized protein YneF (UPF0154 family)
MSNELEILLVGFVCLMLGGIIGAWLNDRL